MAKRFFFWLLAGLTCAIVPLIAFLYLAAMNVDCDQFACIGYVILLGPIFLLGLLIMIIVIITGIVVTISEHSKKNKNESFN